MSRISTTSGYSWDHLSYMKWALWVLGGMLCQPLNVKPFEASDLQLQRNHRMAKRAYGIQHAHLLSCKQPVRICNSKGICPVAYIAYVSPLSLHISAALTHP